MPFVKLDTNILTSSVWAEDSDTLRVWIYLLASSDSNGIVRATVPAIALQCGLDVQVVRASLERFAAPDGDSRTAKNEGRRIRIEREPRFEIRLLNFETYRKKDHTAAARQRRHRDKKRNGVTSRDSRDRHSDGRDRHSESPGVTQAEAEADKDKTKDSSAASAAGAPGDLQLTPPGDRPRKGRHKGNPDVPKLILHYATEFKRVKGTKPLIEAADAAAAAKVLAGRSLEDAQALVTRFLETPDDWAAERGLLRLRDLPAAVTKILARGAPGGGNGRRAAQHAGLDAERRAQFAAMDRELDEKGVIGETAD